MNLTPKMLAARKLLTERFHDGFGGGKGCAVILDMLRYTTKVNPIPALMTVPGFRSLKSTKIQPPPLKEFQGYGRGHWFKRVGTGMKFCVESKPREPWLAPFAVTMFADDRTGLVPADVFPLRELMMEAKLTVVEVAVDFPVGGAVNRRFVLRYGVFGKSRRDLSNNNPAVDWWGSKNSGKRVKSYRKDVIAAHRVELRVRRRFFEPHGIDDLFDLVTFADLLPGGHVLFARLDETKLIKQLRKHRQAEKALAILKQVIELEGDLTAQLSFLRRSAGLKNVRRLLIPLRTNGLVREAFKVWEALWPKTPARVGKKP